MSKEKREKPRLAQLTSSADVVQSLFQNGKSQLADGFIRYKMESQWESVVGPALAPHTRPFEYRDGVLTIAVGSSTWLQQLWFFKEDLKSRVNKHVGHAWAREVKFIVARI
jgi:predicted nucleic acid-binding Zn ribbon protein